MVAHRLGTQDKMGGDLSIGLALGDQGENLVFAVRQLREELRGSALRSWSSAAEIVHQAFCDGRTKDRLAVSHSANGAQGLLLYGALEQLAARSSPNGSKARQVTPNHPPPRNPHMRPRSPHTPPRPHPLPPTPLPPTHA